MDAKDLMIGDWVQNPLGATGWVKNIQLFPKEDDGFGGYYVIDIAYSKNGDSYARMEEKDISPIPLTEEILERNGFKLMHGFGYSNNYPTLGWGEAKENFRVHCSINVTFYDEPIAGVNHLVKMERNSLSGDGINQIHSCDINYVHELQHAIRVCGIEKEIIL